MKRTSVITFCVLMACMSLSAQNVTIRDVQIAYEKGEVIRNYLREERNDLVKKKEEKERLVKRYQDRCSFSPSTSEDNLEDKLKSFESFEDMYADRGEVYRLLDDFPDSELSKTYLYLLEVTESLHHVYDRQTNEKYKKTSVSIVGKLLIESHRQSFRKIMAGVNDYRFVMFELSRVLDLIDIAGKSISYEKLERDDELADIAKVPYAVKRVRDYLASNLVGRSVIRNELSTACPDAF